MKKVLMGFVGLLALLLLALAAIPMFYDVNKKLKPMIVEQIEQNTNAKVEIGDLSMSLWGQVKIGISSLRLKEPDGNTVFEVKDAKLVIPLYALLLGKFDIDFVAMAPKLNIVSDQQGKLNVFKLMKAAPAKTQTEANTKSSAGGSGGVAASGSRLSFNLDIEKADISYKDLKANTTSNVKDLSLKLIDIGLNKPFTIESTSDLALSGKDYELKGPAHISGSSKITFDTDGFKSFDLNSRLDLSKLYIKYGNLFRKEPNVALLLAADLTATPNSANLRSIVFAVNDLKIITSGTISNFDSPEVDIKVKSSDLSLEHWKKILAVVNDFDLSGKASFDFFAKGTIAKLQYGGSFDFKNGGAHAPGIKQPLTDINASVKLATDSVKIEHASMKIGQSDMSMAGSANNFASPVVRVNVQSKLFNMDELFPPTTVAAPGKTAKGGSGTGSSEESMKDDALEGPVDMLKKNPVLRKLDFAANAKMNKLIMHAATLTEINTDMTFKNLVLTLKNTSLKAFNGKANVNLTCDFSAPKTTYKIGGAVEGVDINAAVTSQFADLKDSVKGNLYSKMNIAGEGVKVSEVKKNLTGKGDFKILNGSWSALAGLKMLGEKLKSIPQAKDKLSGLSMGDKFKTMRSNFTIKDSRFYLEKAEMDMEETRTALHGDGWVNFDKIMYFKGDILAPLSDAPSSLKTADGRAKIPVEFGGPMMGPNVKWEVTTNALAQAYLRGAGEKAVSEGLKNLKDSVKDENAKKILDKIPANAGDLLKNLKF